MTKLALAMRGHGDAFDHDWSTKPQGAHLTGVGEAAALNEQAVRQLARYSSQDDKPRVIPEERGSSLTGARV